MKFKIVSIVAFYLVIGIGISYAALEDGLISAWTFDDGTAKDWQGKNRGEILGGVEVVDGKFEKALSFDGKDGHVQIPHAESMELLKDGLTVSAWIRSRAGGVNGNGMIAKGKGSGWGITYSFKIALGWSSPDNSICWGVCNESTEGYFQTTDVIEPDKWFFVCLTADGKEAVGYVAGEDGKVKIPPSGEGNPKALAAPYLTESGLPIEIGVAKLANGTTDGFFDGIIDEVYLWDRALSEDEIAQLAQGTRPNFSNLVEPGGKLSTLWGIIKSQNR